MGINTDGWQPIERQLGLTRALLGILAEYRHPVSIITKGALIERDIDLLADMARDKLVSVLFSITTLDKTLARSMEPRASTPLRRQEVMKKLHEAGIPVGVLFAPLIPALNDHEMENVITAAHKCGACVAGYSLLRLPYELGEIFPAWLRKHYPDRAEHTLSLLRQMHGGKLYENRFNARMRGNGVFAEAYSHRLHLLCKRLGLNQQRTMLNTQAFCPLQEKTQQMMLF